MDNGTISHTCWKCQYHIVFITKYRKKVLYGKIRDDIREIISMLCTYKDVEIISGIVYIDHVYLSVAIPPCGAALWRANNKSLLEVVVANLEM